MKIEDTVMSDEQLEENVRKDYKNFRVVDESGYNQDILIWTREAQAEYTWDIAYKAGEDKGHKEVVEWLREENDRHPQVIDGSFIIAKLDADRWFTKLVEWGIDG